MFQKYLLLLLLASILTICSTSEEWNYKKHGEDWHEIEKTC